MLAQNFTTAMLVPITKPLDDPEAFYSINISFDIKTCHYCNIVDPQPKKAHYTNADVAYLKHNTEDVKTGPRKLRQHKSLVLTFLSILT